MKLNIVEHIATDVMVIQIPMRISLAVDKSRGLVFLNSKRRLVPCLALLCGSEVLYPEEAFRWSLSLLPKKKAKIIWKMLSSVARLFEYWVSVSHFPLILKEDFDTLIWAFLYERLNCPSDVLKRRFKTWAPIRYETAVAEFSDIRDFVNFCSKQTRFTTILGQAMAEGSGVFEFKLPSHETDRFFSHLSAQWDRWAKIVGPSASYPSDLANGRARGRHRSSRERTFTTGDVEKIVEYESNLVFKMLWLLLAYVGIRVSEALQLWRCDVLPGSYSLKFTNFSMDGVPFIVIAHPERSM